MGSGRLGVSVVFMLHWADPLSEEEGEMRGRGMPIPYSSCCSQATWAQGVKSCN